ncbi:methyltransferase domain-containing protein [Leifsonia sp. ZF2019]|uniref:methyltransferase domain-containing protein n=1 Tax=Leifsonia sp. ZF2019 TaxID=2781978 RepID=UPI001CBC0E23|nr:methyltransferase domain-containing protein [Leifsonia sp. ZF2019]
MVAIALDPVDGPTYDAHVVRWDPERYRAFAEERARPFLDLTSRLDGLTPSRIVDLGCGTGELTATLADRWPDADVLGIDSSPDMLAATGPLAAEHPRLAFQEQAIEGWEPDPDVDLVVSNAALQWVPTHRELMRGWLTRLRPGATIAVQVPGNEDSASQVLVRELAAEPRWADALAGAGSAILRVGTMRDYVDVFLDGGHRVEAWETTYQHVLPGEDAVLGWLSGTRLRPYLAALGARADEFVEELRPRLRAAYPTVSGATLFPFRRLFVVGTARP